MEKKQVNANIGKVLASGKYDAIINGEIVQNLSDKTVLVTAETDLRNLTDYAAGTIAYTAGFQAMWQLDASGSWVSSI